MLDELEECSVRKKRYWLPIAGAALYLFLLVLLSYSEKDAAGTQITNLSDAFWYSIVTMTTVGYGDAVPQTAFGRVIGCIFLFISLGVLTSLLSLAYSLVMGRLIPRIRLWYHRAYPWHVFPKANAESIAMASALEAENPQNVTIFLEEQNPGDMTLSLSPAQILDMAKGPVSFYFLGDTPPEICRSAAALTKSPCRVFCGTQFPECFGDGTFLPEKAGARLYWRAHPLGEHEKTVLLIGGERWLPMILEQALLVNLYSPDQQLQYHVYGDHGVFLRGHYRLEEFCAVNGSIPGRDSIWFHNRFPSPELLAQADRIILCGDTQEENLTMLNHLRTFFPVAGTLYARLDHALPERENVIIFGTVEELYTPENVIHAALDDTARKIYEPYRQMDPGRNPEWDALPLESKEDNYAPADHVLPKLQILLDDRRITAVTAEICAKGMAAYRAQFPERQDFFRELEHLRWCRWRYLRNWTYAPQRNNAQRKHNLLCPYQMLSESEKQKDDSAWEVIGTLFPQ